MAAPKQPDARLPTMPARLMRGCRDNWLSRSDAIRSRPRLQRTASPPLPYRVVSKARPREFPQIPIPAATGNRPTCFWPCAVRRRRPPEYAQGLSISIHCLLASNRQAGHEILRLQTQLLVSRHRRQQIHRLASDLFDHICRVSESQPEQTNQLGPHRIVEIVAIPNRVADTRGVRTQSYVPGQLRVTQFRQRFDRDIDCEQMPK